MAAANSSTLKTLKHWSLVRCSKQIREQKARIYIIWRCTISLVATKSIRSMVDCESAKA
uniref:Putative DVL n=1 Tax=Helianthus annuus TaxID=4232 RepID=A0A251UEH7_HELAN